MNKELTWKIISLKGGFPSFVAYTKNKKIVKISGDTIYKPSSFATLKDYAKYLNILSEKISKKI